MHYGFLLIRIASSNVEWTKTVNRYERLLDGSTRIVGSKGPNVIARRELSCAVTQIRNLSTLNRVTITTTTGDADICKNSPIIRVPSYMFLPVHFMNGAPYLLYSPDLASFDFFLFIHIKQQLEGHIFLFAVELMKRSPTVLDLCVSELNCSAHVSCTS
jgi:hypothetical protein